MAELEGGPVLWKGSRDREGHREYQVQFKVRCEVTEGPASALQTPGLPLPGDLWAYLDDLDVYAWCKNEVEIEPSLEREKNKYFFLTYTYSTKPDRLCQDHRIEDPLLEPQRIRGSSNKYEEVATKDRFGKRLVNHAYEPIRGDTVKFDANRPGIQIEQNVIELEFDLLCAMLDRVNNEPMWGLPRRSIKLSDVTWERHYHGSCQCYFKRTFVFDVNVKFSDETSEAVLVSGFDRDIMLEGTKVLNGYWDEDTGLWALLAAANGGLDLIGTPRNPDPYNPAHYIRAVDRRDNPITIIYDGRGNHRGEPYNPEDQIEYVDGCSECISGTLRYWLVDGIPNVGSSLNTTLEHTLGCVWTTTLFDGTLLNLSVGVGQWELRALYPTPWPFSPTAGGSTFEIYWSLDVDEWNCVDSNTLTLLPPLDPNVNVNLWLIEAAAMGIPTTVTLHSDEDSNVAELHVEHYEEDDFLKLAIPVTLDCNSY